MHANPYVERLVNLIDPAGNLFFNCTREEADAAVASGDPERVRAIDGPFAIAQKSGRTVRMARSIGRPMRYFLAKRAEGPCLIVAERMDELREQLSREGLEDQFHPSYTRMVPAHYIVEIDLVGCPDPNPRYERFFTPERNTQPADLDAIGAAYIGALSSACNRWLNTLDPREPIGVLFSGGVDSGAVFLALYDALLKRGESPARLKAFTLSVHNGPDARQAHNFLASLGLSLFLEVMDIALEDLDYADAIRTIEDYKPLDVQAATMTLALCRAIRNRYPDWRYLADGDGGDENLKDYPIEENPELTIRSVLNNLMLYQEGWGVHSIKHSLTFTGGQSRGHVRSYAPARALGFQGFSPFALPNVIAVAEGIPFIDLTGWDPQKLYALKGEVVRRGIEAVTGMAMPVNEKRRFQHGAVDAVGFQAAFPRSEAAYRRAFDAAFE
ncbi:MAG: asparagine synthase-related protein [Rhodothermales bacterium]|nr:asparagine synthase-related protein [Rhodothermales bacterium]